MKKILALILIIITLTGFTACAKKAEDAETDAPSQATEEALETATEGDAETGKDAETEKTSENEKEVFWATENKDSSDVWYHTKDCDMIKDKSPDVLPWEIINALGMTACEKCNP